MTTVINSILIESGIRGVKVSSRLFNIFKKRFSILQSAYKRARKSGGTPANRLVNSWKNSTYSLSVHYNEIEVIDLHRENEKRKCEKRSLEDALELESAKRIRLEGEVNVLEKTVKKKEIAYKGKFKQLVKKIARLTGNKKVRGPDKKKAFQDYTRQHQARVRKQLRDQCETALSFLGHYEFLPSRVELYNVNTGEVETFVHWRQ